LTLVIRESIALIKTFMPFVCRPAQISDQDAIAYLAEQWGYQTSREKMVQSLRDILQHSDHRLILLQQRTEIAGFIHGIYSFRIASDPFVEIVGLVVDSRFRRLGMGKCLVDEIVQWARIRCSSHVRVKCHIIRKDANLFYSNIGFKEIKQQKVYDLIL
jgi:GNAT superfamily N-acetyltransferase